MSVAYPIKRLKQGDFAKTENRNRFTVLSTFSKRMQEHGSLFYVAVSFLIHFADTVAVNTL
jgi:hypothetical protein